MNQNQWIDVEKEPETFFKTYFGGETVEDAARNLQVLDSRPKDWLSYLLEFRVRFRRSPQDREEVYRALELSEEQIRQAEVDLKNSKRRWKNKEKMYVQEPPKQEESEPQNQKRYTKELRKRRVGRKSIYSQNDIRQAVLDNFVLTQKEIAEIVGCDQPLIGKRMVEMPEISQVIAKRKKAFRELRDNPYVYLVIADEEKMFGSLADSGKYMIEKIKEGVSFEDIRIKRRKTDLVVKLRRQDVLVEDVRKAIYSQPVVTQAEVGKTLGITRYDVIYRFRGQDALRMLLKIRTQEAKGAKKEGKPLYIVRSNGDEYCTSSLRELGEYMLRYRNANKGILNVDIYRRSSRSIPTIRSVR